MPIIISGGGGGGAISGVTVTGVAAAGQAPIATTSNSGAWTYPPGYEIAYQAASTATTISATTEATANTIVSAGAVTFDGTAVWIEFYAALIEPGATALSSVSIYLFLDGATQGSIWFAAKDDSAVLDAGEAGCYAKVKQTPSAGSHTYTIRGSKSGANGTVAAGAGGAGVYVPCYVRISKA